MLAAIAYQLSFDRLAKDFLEDRTGTANARLIKPFKRSISCAYFSQAGHCARCASDSGLT
jgi:hypothetical protein